MTIQTETVGMSARTAMPAHENLQDFGIIRRLLRDYMGHQWPALALAVFCMMSTAALTGVLAWVIDPAIRLIFEQKRVDMLVAIPLGVVAVVALRALAGFGEQALINSIGERIVAAAQRDMLRNQIRLDLASLNAVHSGELVSKFLYDTTLLRGAITRGVAGLGKEFVTLVALAAVMIYQDWKLSIISVVVLPAVAWVTQRLGRSLRKSATLGMKETGTLSTALSEALAGRRVIKAYGLEEYAAKSAENRIARRLKYILKTVRTRSAAVPATDLFGGLVIAATIFYAGYQSLHGELTFGRFSSFIAAMLLAQQPPIACSPSSMRNPLSWILQARRRLSSGPRRRVAPFVSTMWRFPIRPGREPRSTTFRSIYRRVGKSLWWARRAPAKPPSSICCCDSTISIPDPSSSTARTSAVSRLNRSAPTSPS
jgi:subfamily B ATP-binding cassette protein MsbA